MQNLIKRQSSVRGNIEWLQESVMRHPWMRVVEVPCSNQQVKCEETTWGLIGRPFTSVRLAALCNTSQQYLMVISNKSYDTINDWQPPRLWVVSAQSMAMAFPHSGVRLHECGKLVLERWGSKQEGRTIS